MPNHSADEYYESGMMYYQRGDLPAAVRMFEKAIFSHSPSKSSSLAAAYNNRGNLLKALGNGFDALLNYDRAIALEPNVAEYYQNKGATLADNMAEMAMAEREYEKALDLNPNLTTALVNLGNVHKATGRRETAIKLYRRAIEVDPDYVDAHLNLSFALLDLGQYEEGWREYEWRWRSGQLPPRGLSLKPWNGEPLAPDQAVVVYGEQGHGDSLQFMRYAPMVKNKSGAKVYVEVRQPLARIARTLEGIDGVAVFGEKMPDDATHCVAMLTLPRVLRTKVETIPAKVPYLKADPHRASMFRSKIAHLPPGLRIGICWAGMYRGSQPAAAMVDQRRSMALQDFSPLTTLAGIGWVSLQMGPPAEQIKTPPMGMTIGDWTDEIDDFADTAALMANLDLVITVDTSVVHLAGALGVPVWLISRYDACWRWMSPSKTTPWYPSLRHYKQESPGDWSTPLAEMRADLSELTKQNQSKAA